MYCDRLWNCIYRLQQHKLANVQVVREIMLEMVCDTRRDLERKGHWRSLKWQYYHCNFLVTLAIGSNLLYFDLITRYYHLFNVRDCLWPWSLKRLSARLRQLNNITVTIIIAHLRFPICLQTHAKCKHILANMCATFSFQWKDFEKLKSLWRSLKVTGNVSILYCLRDLTICLRN